MIREFSSDSEDKNNEKLLLAQGFDSSTTGPQWGLDSPIQGTGKYQVGNQLHESGYITKIERPDAQNCTITLDSNAKLNFHNDHIVKVERPDGSTFEMKHDKQGMLTEIKLPSGDVYTHMKDGWHSADGKKSNRTFLSSHIGSVAEYIDKDKCVFHYPDGTNVHVLLTSHGMPNRLEPSKIEQFGQVLIECRCDGDGLLKQFKLRNGEQWQRQSPMQWKSSKGDVFKGDYYFEDIRTLCRRDVHGEKDYAYKPF